jgi:hypothetical protein
VDHLGLVQAIDGLGQRVVLRIADAAHRGLQTRLGQALGLADEVRPSASGSRLKVFVF